MLRGLCGYFGRINNKKINDEVDSYDKGAHGQKRSLDLVKIGNLGESGLKWHNRLKRHSSDFKILAQVWHSQNGSNDAISVQGLLRKFVTAYLQPVYVRHHCCTLLFVKHFVCA